MYIVGVAKRKRDDSYLFNGMIILCNLQMQSHIRMQYFINFRDHKEGITRITKCKYTPFFQPAVKYLIKNWSAVI